MISPLPGSDLPLTGAPLMFTTQTVTKFRPHPKREDGSHDYYVLEVLQFKFHSSM